MIKLRSQRTAPLPSLSLPPRDSVFVNQERNGSWIRILQARPRPSPNTKSTIPNISLISSSFNGVHGRIEHNARTHQTEEQMPPADMHHPCPARTRSIARVYVCEQLQIRA